MALPSNLKCIEAMGSPARDHFQMPFSPGVSNVLGLISPTSMDRKSSTVGRLLSLEIIWQIYQCGCSVGAGRRRWVARFSRISCFSRRGFLADLAISLEPLTSASQFPCDASPCGCRAHSIEPTVHCITDRNGIETLLWIKVVRANQVLDFHLSDIDRDAAQSAPSPIAVAGHASRARRPGCKVKFIHDANSRVRETLAPRRRSGFGGNIRCIPAGCL